LLARIFSNLPAWWHTLSCVCKLWSAVIQTEFAGSLEAQFCSRHVIGILGRCPNCTVTCKTTKLVSECAMHGEMSYLLVETVLAELVRSCTESVYRRIVEQFNIHLRRVMQDVHYGSLLDTSHTPPFKWSVHVSSSFPAFVTDLPPDILKLGQDKLALLKKTPTICPDINEWTLCSFYIAQPKLPYGDILYMNSCFAQCPPEYVADERNYLKLVTTEKEKQNVKNHWIRRFLNQSDSTSYHQIKLSSNSTSQIFVIDFGVNHTKWRCGLTFIREDLKHDRTESCSFGL